MKRVISLTLLSVLICGSMSAQEISATKSCVEGRLNKLPAAKITVADPAEDDYDMQHVKFNLNLTNTSTLISGDVTTRAKVVAASMPAYVFELHTQLIIDSVLFNGTNLPVTSNVHVRTVTLPTALNQNDVFNVQVFYHGQPTSGTGFFSRGLNTATSPSWNAQVTYTLSQPYMAKDWWPTKQSLTDKIDSADIWITVASTLKAGSNGLLKNITPMPGNKSRYEWKTTYPIDHYLLSASVAPYVDYSYFIKFTGSSDSMLFQNYIYSNPQTLPFWKARIDSVAGMIDYFSQIYGRYPFWEEKYGHCMAPISGGMEHQTMTTQGTFGTTLSAHELGHQWFGDNVTCGSWKDIWLNEGFASYTEYIYVDQFRGPQDAFNYMLDKHINVLTDTGGSVYVDDTTNANRIFSSRLTYDKGASIVHTLRFIFDNDSLFFKTLQNYQNQFKGSTAVTTDFQAIAEQALGQNLTKFFDQWIYKEGYPIFSAKWNQIADTVIVELEQATSHSSVSLFETPIELQLISPQGDTTVRVDHNSTPQKFYFTWGKPMQNMAIDPNDWLLNDEGLITHDATLLNATETYQASFKVYPNPTRDAWNVTDLPEKSSLQLMDMNGRIIWKEEASHTAVIPASNLAQGVYLLKINSNKAASTTKLIKQ